MTEDQNSKVFIPVSARALDTLDVKYTQHKDNIMALAMKLESTLVLLPTMFKFIYANSITLQLDNVPGCAIKFINTPSLLHTYLYFNVPTTIPNRTPIETVLLVAHQLSLKVNPNTKLFLVLDQNIVDANNMFIETLRDKTFTNPIENPDAYFN